MFEEFHVYFWEKKPQSFKETKYIKFNKPMEIILCELVTLHAYRKCS